MGKRTLASCWKQYEKLSWNFLDNPSQKGKIQEKLENLTEKTNADEIGNALFTLFVQPYTNLSNSVKFTVNIDEDPPSWQTKYDSENLVIWIHPVGVFNFLKSIINLKSLDPTEENFVRCRNINFLIEISKLSTTYILFLLVLQRVAYLLEIAHLEKRGGVVEIAEDESYHTLLWAFKELENFVRKTYGINIRAHFGISWYEAEWITGR